jgi:acyl-CoA dehydrogenase-like protein
MAVKTAYSEQTEIQRDITEMVRQFADEQIIPNAEHYDHEDSFRDLTAARTSDFGLPASASARTYAAITHWQGSRLSWRGSAPGLTPRSQLSCPASRRPI